MKTELFEPSYNRVIPWPSFPQAQIQNKQWLVLFQIITSQCGRKGKRLKHFQSENPVFHTRADDGTGPELSTVCPFEIVTSVTQVSLACDGQATFRKVTNLKLCFCLFQRKLKDRHFVNLKFFPQWQLSVEVMLTATLTLGKKMFGGSARHRENVFNLTKKIAVMLIIQYVKRQPFFSQSFKI